LVRNLRRVIPFPATTFPAPSLNPKGGAGFLVVLLEPQPPEAAMANNTGRKTLKKADLLKAIKIPESTFEHWTDRKVIEPNREDLPGDGRGKPRRFGLRTAKKLAIAHKISQLRIPANAAVKLAEMFTDDSQIGRTAGDLFPIGVTYILATPSGSASVVNVKPEEDVSQLLQDATIVVNVNQILSAINFEIGIIK
jgi:hypothetical protein